jgi:glutamate racemase
LVEEGWIDGPVPRLAVERYTAPLVEQDVGVVVLGCTHYPVLKTLIVDVLGSLAPRPVGVVDSAEATAEAVEALLGDRALAHDGSRAQSLELLVTDLPASFSAMAERCLGEAPPRVEQVDL